MPKEEKTTRNREVEKAAIAPTRSVKRLFSLAHERAARAIVSVSLAAALASCSPTTLNAQETVKPPKDKPVAAAVEKKVTYETIADLSELQPYLDAAKDKLVKIEKLAEYVITESFVILPMRSGSGTLFRIFVRDDSKPDKLGQEIKSTLADKLPNVAVIETSVDDNHPVIKGKLLIFACPTGISFAYFDKKLGRYENAGPFLGEGNMREVPVQIGYGVNEDNSIFALSMPREIRPGDVIGQGDIAADGSMGKAYYVYAPDKPSGTLVASIAMR